MSFINRFLVSSQNNNNYVPPSSDLGSSAPSPSQSKESKVAQNRLIEQGITFTKTTSTKKEQERLLEASVSYNKTATEIGKLLQHFGYLYTQLQNPSNPDQVLFQQLQKIAPDELKTELKKNIALFNQENADEVLEKNPRILLQIKDHNGKNLIEHYLAHLANRLQNLRDLGNLYYIQHLLGALDLATSSTDKGSLHSEIRKSLSGLSLTAQDKIVAVLKEHLTAPSDSREILELIATQPKILLQNFSGKRILTYSISKSESKIHLPFYFSGAYWLADQIVQNDSPETVQSITQLNQLQDFYTQLLQPSSIGQKKLIFKQFSKLDPEIKTALGKSLWLAHFKPDFLLFADNLIEKNPYILLECQDPNGRDIVIQLINHYKSKSVLQRFFPVFVTFATHFNQTQDNQKLLEAFDSLPVFGKSDLASLVWLEHGGKHDPKFGGWGYGETKILENPSILKEGNPSFLDKYAQIIQGMTSFRILEDGVNAYEKKTLLIDDVINCSASSQLADPTLEKELPQDMRIAMVAAEFAGVISMGGLAPAVEGMARSYGVDKTRIVLPKYDVINPKIKLVEKPKYQVKLAGEIHNIFKGKVSGFKCYFIQDEVFNVGRNEEGKPNNIYNGTHGSRNPDAEVKRRWTHFQSHAAELIYQFSQKKRNPVQLVHVHDAQTALIPKIMEARHFDEWKEGKTPATVFTYHNNNCPLPYDYCETQQALSEIGLPFDPINSFIEGLEHADMSTTVSETFAKESQTKLYGKGMESEVRINGFKGKIVGIVNGNTNGWNPKTDAQLKNWRTVDGKPLDLTYGPDDADLPKKIQLIRQQLAEYLDHHKLGVIDPTRPIFFYVGRYDAYQKGIDKLPLIMTEAIKNRAQFICIGLEPDQKADAALKQMEAFANSRNNQGVCIIRDEKRKGDGRLHWQQGNTPEDKSGVPGFGNLLRSAVDVGIFPSIFEPCGLVQGEMHRMGVETAATATGGFVDTIFTSGPNQNGYLFAKFPDWESEEQDNAIRATVKEATEKAQARLHALYQGNAAAKQESVRQKRTIMQNAANSTWEKTFDGSLSPIEKLTRAYGKSMRFRNKRGIIFTDLQGLRMETYA